MTDIRLDFFFEHPPERVWRAMTESRLVAEWLAENDLVPRAGHQFRLRPVGLPGLDGLVNADVIEVVELGRLDMIWRTDDMHLGVTWQLRVAPGGTTVEVTQTGYLGVHGTSRRDALRRAYEEAFDGRLRDVLADLAAEHERASQAKSKNYRLRERRDAIPAYAADAGPVDPWAAAATEHVVPDPGPMIFEPSPPSGGEWVVGSPRDPSFREYEREAAAAQTGSAPRSCVGVALLAVLLTACAVVLTVWFGTPGAPSPPNGALGDGPLMASVPGGTAGTARPLPPGTGGPGAGPGATGGPAVPGVTSGPPGATDVAGPDGPETGPLTVTAGPGEPEPSEPAPEEPGPADLTAFVSGGSDGYVVIVTNPGGVAVSGWTVAVTITGGSPVGVVGATVSKHGNRVTFTPTGDTAVVPAQGSVSFSFDSPGTVRACAIDGRSCG